MTQQKLLYNNESIDMLKSFNLWLAGIGSCLYVLMIITDSHLMTEGLNRIFTIRAINLVVYSAVFFYSCSKNKKLTVPLSIALISSTLFGMSIITQATRDYAINATSWALLAVLFIGLYPLDIKFSLPVFAAALTHLIINFFLKEQGEYEKYDFLTLFYNTLIALVIAVGFSYLLSRMRKKEIESRLALEKANSELKSFDQLKTNFFSNISHELKTPLTMIYTPIERVIQEKRLPDSIRFFHSLKLHSRRLLVLVNTLLDFSRIEEGKLTLKKGRYNVSSLVQFVAASFASAMEQKNIKYTISLHPEIDAVFDSGLIDKAIYNLLSNAVKFTPENGEVTITLCATKKEVQLTVSDSGIGIPSDKLETIFDRFGQVDNSASRRYEGSGIGLAFARSIVELHGGRLSVQSTFGQGSSFALTLPRGDTVNRPLLQWQEFEKEISTYRDNDSRVSAKDMHKESLKTSKNGSRPLILLAEDNMDMRSLIEECLEDQYEVVTATNGRTALRLISQLEDPPDLILSDVMMPEMDGYEFTKQVRKIPELESVPVLLLTARSESYDSLSGFKSGAMDYIIKPFNVGEVRARIAAHIQMKKLRDRLLNANFRLEERLKKITKGSSVNGHIEDIVNQITACINENYLDPDLTRARLADSVGVSESYLSTTFNSYTGEKITDYINSLRVEKAKKLLQRKSDLPVSRIGLEVGFDSIRQFNRAFKKKVGTSPSEYRDKQSCLNLE